MLEAPGISRPTVCKNSAGGWERARRQELYALHCRRHGGKGCGNATERAYTIHEELVWMLAAAGVTGALGHRSSSTARARARACTHTPILHVGAQTQRHGNTHIHMHAHTHAHARQRCADKHNAAKRRRGCRHVQSLRAGSSRGYCADTIGLTHYQYWCCSSSEE